MKRPTQWSMTAATLAISLWVLVAHPAATFAQGSDIVSALYGAQRNVADVTNQVRSMARNGSLNFRVNNDAFRVGDPAPNQVKTLHLRVRDSYGRTKTYQYREGETVNLQLGWTNPPNRPGGPGYGGRLNSSDQQRFDSYYSRWLGYQRDNNYGEIRSMEKRMYDVYKQYGIPASVPFAQVASSSMANPDPDGEAGTTYA